jgi:predicted nuclease with TOPRIM domain
MLASTNMGFYREAPIFACPLKPIHILLQQSKIKELEKENTSLQDELYECNRKIQRMEKVIKTLEGKQRQADLTRSRGGTAVITRQELAEMRAQVGLLEATEKNLIKAEKNEVNLKETIAQLRRGKVSYNNNMNNNIAS